MTGLDEALAKLAEQKRLSYGDVLGILRHIEDFDDACLARRRT
jgi:hypothetical protein